MKKLLLIIQFALLGVAVGIIIWQQQQASRLEAESSAARAELQRLQAENAKLADQLKSSLDRAQTDRQELARLRAQDRKARDIQQENAQLKSEREALTQRIAQQPVALPQPNDNVREDKPAEVTQEKKQIIAKMNFSRKMAMELLIAADGNNGRFPNTLTADQIRQLEQDPSALENGVRADAFERIYQGTMTEVKDPSKTVLAREREPMQMANGKWAKSYTFVDGHSELISADSRDGFPEMEKRRGMMLSTP